MPTPEEIRAAVQAGPASTMALIEALLAENVRLQARVKELEARLNQDSHNSSHPPSSDPPHKKRGHGRRPTSDKPSGGQVGHPGTTRALVEKPDELIVLTPTVCDGCGADLATGPVVERKRRQVLEVPAPQPVVTEYQALSKACPHCLTITGGQFPAAVSQPVQYGPQAQALMTYLQGYQLLSYERTAEAMRDLFGLEPSEGTLANVQKTAYRALAPVENALKDALVVAPMVHLDETGVRTGAATTWVHVASTATLTFYAAHASRGGPAIDAINLLPQLQGWRIHDAYPAYLTRPGRFGLCNAHLLRELTAIYEDTGQPWAQTLIGVLLHMKDAVRDALHAQQTAVPTRQRAGLEAAFSRYVTQGLNANPAAPPSGKPGRTKQSDAHNLLKRLVTQREAVLAFLHHFEVPFDNNQAERDLRMFKVKHKISGCFRSALGAAYFCRIRGYIATLRKQGLSILNGLTSVFLGKPMMPCLKA